MSEAVTTLQYARDPLARAKAAEALGLARDPSLVSYLIVALHDEDKEVRSAVTQALIKTGMPASGPLCMLLKDPEWKVRFRSAEALGAIGDYATGPALMHALNDPKDHVRFMAAKSLGLLSYTPARELLTARLDDENPYVKRMAALALKDLPLE